MKRQRGTYRKDRDTAAIAAPTTPGEPAMPSGMPEVAQRRWREVAPALVAAGMLAERDGGALEAYCREYARWLTLQEAAGARPMVKSPYGPKANPAGIEARKVHREVIQPLELALGLHYAARSRLRKPDTGGEADPVADELFGPLTALQGGKAE